MGNSSAWTAKSSGDDGSQRLVRSLFLLTLGRAPNDVELDHWSTAIGQGMNIADILEAFLGSEERARQRGAKLFVPPGHFYSPVVEPEEARRHLDALRAKPLADSLPGLSIDRDAMVDEWHRLLPFLISAPFEAERKPGLHYCYINPAYSWGDGSMLHAVLRRYRPRRLIEIGSGWSSACAVDTVTGYLGGDCRMTLIEPYPKLVLELLGEAATCTEIIESRVQDVSPEIFDALEANDVLFIDSTHVIKTGSDVCFELFEVLPRLAPGVLVHIHDMFWPFEYPQEWAVEENRSWNELYGVRAFLTHNDSWEFVMFNNYLTLLERDLIDRTFPDFLKNPGGALWLRRR